MRHRHAFQLATSAAFVAFAVIAVGRAAHANDYYVDPAGGSDSNDGSPGSPWQTMTHAIENFSIGSSGTVIHAADGEYASFAVTRGGSSEAARLTLLCDSGAASGFAAQGKCKVSSGSIGINVSKAGANHVVIHGWDVGDDPDMGTGIAVGVGANCGTSGLSTCGNDVQVIGNYVHDLGANTGDSSKPTGGIGCPSSGAIAIGTHGVYETGIQVVGNVVLRYGLYPHPNPNCNQAHGIYLGTKGGIVENNLIVSAPGSNLHVYGIPCQNVVSNNVMIGSNTNMYYSGDGEGVCPTLGSSTINNNIMYGATRQHISTSHHCTSATPNFWGHNLTDGGTDWDNEPSACDNVEGIGGGVELTHESGDTTFTDYKTDGTGTYTIKAGSVAILGGTVTCSTGDGALSPCVPTLDILGATRASPPTVGVFEYGVGGAGGAAGASGAGGAGAGGAPGSGASSANGGSGLAGSGGKSATGGSGSGSKSGDDDAGCGCRSTKRAPSPGSLALIFAIGVFAIAARLTKYIGQRRSRISRDLS